jgi:hypothetical protein
MEWQWASWYGGMIIAAILCLIIFICSIIADILDIPEAVAMGILIILLLGATIGHVYGKAPINNCPCVEKVNQGNRN